MRRWHSLWWSLAVIPMLAASAEASHARTPATIAVEVEQPPPAPVIALREVPRVTCIEGSGVCVVSDPRVDLDCFRYGVWWFAWHQGWWYRARSHRGPFVPIATRSVPRAIFTVPSECWKHPPRVASATTSAARSPR